MHRFRDNGVQSKHEIFVDLYSIILKSVHSEWNEDAFYLSEIFVDLRNWIIFPKKDGSVDYKNEYIFCFSNTVN